MSDWLENGWLATVDRLASPNFGARPAGRPVSLIVIHNISLPPGEFEGRWVADFFLNRLDRSAHPYFETIADVQVSAHFYIERDGRIVQFIGPGMPGSRAGVQERTATTTRSGSNWRARTTRLLRRCSMSPCSI